MIAPYDMDNTTREQVSASLIQAAQTIMQGQDGVVEAGALSWASKNAINLIENMLRSAGFDDSDVEETISDVQKSLRDLEAKHSSKNR